MKNGAYVVNENKWIETHCTALYVNGNNVTYFGSFGVEHISEELKVSKTTKIS